MVSWVQKTAPMYRIAFLWLSSSLLLACSQNQSAGIPLPYYNEPTFSPIFLTDQSEVSDHIDHTIGAFEVLNQDSLIITEQIFKDKIHVANFIFTSCGSICPSMTANMKTVSDYFKKDNSIYFLSFSVTPWIDSPQVLRKYRETNEIHSKNWQFLTGQKAEIYDLARKSYFAEEDIGFSKDSTDFLHTEHFILVDQTQRIRGIYNGSLALEMKELIADIETLKTEK